MNMQLPEDLQHFQVPTLILIGDFREARCYLADDGFLRALQTVNAPKPARPDSGGSVNIGGGRYINPDSGVDEGSDRAHYSKHIAAALTALAAEYHAGDVQLVMPAEMLRRVKDELPPEIQALVLKTLDKALMKEDLLDVIERLKKLPKPV